MVSAAKAFAKEPPRRPLVDLDAVVEDFQWRYVDRKKTDQVIEYCRNAENFIVAVRRAVEARDANGKHHNHQSKVDITARRKFGAKIIRHLSKITGFMYGPYAFDELHDLFDEIKPYGIGPVTVYDVAVRIGAYLGIEPISVYMHAGVRQGFKVLIEHNDRMRGSLMYRWRRVPIMAFPQPLCDLRADDVEDILCTYREVFETW